MVRLPWKFHDKSISQRFALCNVLTYKIRIDNSNEQKEKQLDNNNKNKKNTVHAYLNQLAKKKLDDLLLNMRV